MLAGPQPVPQHQDRPDVARGASTQRDREDAGGEGEQAQSARRYDKGDGSREHGGAVVTDRDWPGAIGRTARRYGGCGRFTRHYVASKLKRDPIHLDLLGRAGPDKYGRVLDIGCGRGQVGILLLEAGLADHVIGLDLAGPCLADARRAGAGLAFLAERQDLGESPQLPPCDTVLLIDVLYQLGPEAARSLLASAAATARRRVLVRTLDPGLGWRSRLSITLERLGRRAWPHSGRRVEPLPVPALVGTLQAAGFAATVTPSWQGTPFANVLLDGRQ